MPLRELKQLGYFTFFRAGFPIYSAAMVRALALSSNYKSVRYRLGWIHAWQFVLLFLFVLGCSVPSAKVRTPAPDIGLSQIGIASWYGPGFHGKATASGIIYDQNEFTAAHQTLPLGTRVLVTKLEIASTTEVTINDSGHFAYARIFALSNT